MSRQAVARKLGRPRHFCEEAAIDAAMRLFWERGYEGASLSGLTDAMGIGRPNLYATFGDKESLFLRVLQRYEDGPASYLKKALEEPTAADVIRRLLTGSVNLLGDPGNPRGDLITQSALATGAGAAHVKQALIDRRHSNEVELLERFRRAKADGDLPKGTNVHNLAGYVCAVLYGLSVLAVNGNSEADLKRVADMAYQMLIPFQIFVGLGLDTV